jgi:receptor protein-tyrosine kinase
MDCRHAWLALADDQGLEVRMTAQTKTAHLIERAAQRLRGMEDLARSAPLPEGAEDPALPASPAPASPPSASPAAASSLFAPAPSPASPSPIAAPPPASASLAAAASAVAPVELAVMEAAGMIPWGRKRERIAEEYRVVQSQILRAIDASAKPGSREANTGMRNMVMITSARPGEGKTFSALNIAASIAQFGSRPTLLVDADAKHNSLTHQLGLVDVAGLLDLGAGRALRIEDLVVPTRLDNLSILPIGGRDGTRAELAARVPVATVVERVGRRFPQSVIILDAPPCLSTSDPSALSLIAGHIVMVVEAERTRRGEVEAAIDMVQSCPNITLLLNKSLLTTNSTFGAYYY